MWPHNTQHCSGFPLSPGFLTSASRHAGHVSRVNTRYLVHVTAWPEWHDMILSACVTFYHRGACIWIWYIHSSALYLLHGTEDTNMNYFSKYTSTKLKIINMLLQYKDACMQVDVRSRSYNTSYLSQFPTRLCPHPCLRNRSVAAKIVWLPGRASDKGKRRFAKISQSHRRPLLGPYSGWNRNLLRHFAKQAFYHYK